MATIVVWLILQVWRLYQTVGLLPTTQAAKATIIFLRAIQMQQAFRACTTVTYCVTQQKIVSIDPLLPGDGGTFKHVRIYLMLAYASRAIIRTLLASSVSVRVSTHVHSIHVVLTLLLVIMVDILLVHRKFTEGSDSTHKAEDYTPTY